MPATNQPPLTALRCFLLRDTVQNARDALRKPDDLQTRPVKTTLGYEGTLWFRDGHRNAPKWREFLQPGFQADLPDFKTTSQAAVLIVKTGTRFIAFTFGQGRHLIDLDRCDPDFGLRTALNLSKPGTLTSIDLHTFEERTKHTRIHLSSKGSVDAFGLDVNRDIMRAVAGESKEPNVCRDVAGSEATLAIIARVEVNTLDMTAAALLAAFQRTDYRQNYEWVDKLSRVNDRVLTGQLDDELIRLVNANTIDRIHLAIPEPADPIDVEYVAYMQDGDPVQELSIPGYLAARPRQGPASWHHMRDNHAVWIKRVDQEAVYRGPSIYKCIVAEVDLAGQSYVLTNGSWFKLNQNFATAVRDYVSAIDESAIQLPPWNGSDHEGTYNAAVATADPSILLLDKKLARCYGNSSSVEICDLLSTAKQIVHVKRRDKCSSGLSHLFMQGRNSGEMLVHDPAFLAETRTIITGVNAAFTGQLPATGFKASDYEVVYALMGADTTAVRQRLPFFSQLTLMNAHKALVGMGYRVTVKGIPVMTTAPGPTAAQPPASNGVVVPPRRRIAAAAAS
ncbi:MAG: hypothetical protein AMXMBFR58_27450 [Phycisphaerae bacterium]